MLWEEVGTDHIAEGTGVYGWGVHPVLRMAGSAGREQGSELGSPRTQSRWARPRAHVCVCVCRDEYTQAASAGLSNPQNH